MRVRALDAAVTGYNYANEIESGSGALTPSRMAPKGQVSMRSKSTSSRVQVACAHCGAMLWRIPSRVKRAKHSFCDFRCHNQFKSGRGADVRDLLMSHVDKQEHGCWVWTGYVDKKTGYARFNYPGRSILAHRTSYELFKGPIPDGLHIDHLCRNRRCVNPDHLEAVAQTTNTHRGLSPLIAANHMQVCVRGHSYAEHSYYRDGIRICCRTCEAENQRRRKEARIACR